MLLINIVFHIIIKNKHFIYKTYIDKANNVHFIVNPPHEGPCCFLDRDNNIGYYLFGAESCLI